MVSSGPATRKVKLVFSHAILVKGTLFQTRVPLNYTIETIEFLQFFSFNAMNVSQNTTMYSLPGETELHRIFQ